MSTSMFVSALLGILAIGQPAGLTWESDYGVARQQAIQAQKPLCVVLGAGSNGWQKLSQEGKLSVATEKILAGKYVCVYLNTATPAGQKLAQAFEMSSSTGIVISDKTGDLQAFRHEGDLTNAKLEGYLATYGDPNRVTTRTDSNPDHHTGVRTSYYQTPGNPAFTPSYFQPSSGYCPSCSGGR